MTTIAARAAAAVIVAVGSACLLAPWLGLRDPAAQPDGLVLRDLSPLARADAIRLADGTLRYAHEVRVVPKGGASYRRGSSWYRLADSELAEGGPAVWHVRPMFVLGTDGHGRDLLSRLVWGGRASLAVGFLGAFIAVAVGGAVGVGAGLIGGVVDGVLMRLADLTLSVPRLFLLLLLVALYRPSFTTTVGVIGATTWMTGARVVRGQILSLRERDYVRAARAAGATSGRIALRHLLPGVWAPLLVEGGLRVGHSILLEASLSFLGLGVMPPTPSWGNLIADGRDRLFDAWWISTFPGIAIALTVVAATGLGEALGARTERVAG